MQEIRILEEGAEYPDGRVVSLNAIIWDNGTVPLRQLFTQEWLGNVHNLRRVDNFIVGDIDVEIKPGSVTPYLIKTKAIQNERNLIFLEATLACVYVEKA